MCGRIIVKAKVHEYVSVFDVLNVPALTPSYNVAPTQLVPVVRLKPEVKTREMVMLKWGLIPAWAKEAAIGNGMINARADTVAEKPAYRHAFRRRRCLMVADGFYEWQKANGKKQPYFIGMKDESPFAFAGLWECWKDPANGPVESCALITTDANDLVRPIHDRMPVILQRNDYAKWLDPEVEDAAELQELLVPFPAEGMKAYPASTFVNKPQNNSPECLAPIKVESPPASPRKNLFE
jgi:putative SOS response-associated peptidase YedK